MKYAFMVAWREYAESAKARGFWIGIFLMPAILFLSIQAPIWLEQKAAPIRYFVLVDQSGSFAPVVESSLDKGYQKRLLEALQDYARKHSLPTPKTGLASSATSGPNLGEEGPDSVEAFIRKGGRDFFLKELRPRLKPGAPAFIEPRRIFRQVKLPAGIDAEGSQESLAIVLKPYLRGEKKIEADGHEAELSAAILIPCDLESHIVRPQTSREPHSPATNSSRRPATPRSDAGGSQTQADNASRIPHPAPVLRSASDEGGSTIQYWSINASESKLRDDVERAINAEIRRREYLARGLDSGAIRQVEQTYAPFTSLNPKKSKGQEAINTADVIQQWAPSGFVYLLWLAIFVIIQMLLNNTVEEKSNRIIEVLLSSVTPGELMMGKLFGIAAIGLTMVGAWMLALFGILSWKAGGASALSGQILTILKASNLLPLFVIYFLLGYLMYAGFILSIGSVCNTIKEAQSYMGVLTMIMMVPMLTMTFIPRDPNGPLARLLSWIPIYTPFTMMNRAGADPPLFDLIGTLVLLLVATATALWMAGKIFRIGILRTGQPPGVIEMIRWAIRKEK